MKVEFTYDITHDVRMYNVDGSKRTELNPADLDIEMFGKFATYVVGTLKYFQEHRFLLFPHPSDKEYKDFKPKVKMTLDLKLED